MRETMLSAIALAFALGALVLSEDHPYAPVCLLVSGMPVYLSWLGSFLEAHGVVALDRFVTLLDGPLYVSGVLLIAAWSLWILRHERHWNTSDCGDDADDDDDAKFQCIDKFMEWVPPFVAGLRIRLTAIMQLIDPGQLTASSTPSSRRAPRPSSRRRRRPPGWGRAAARRRRRGGGARSPPPPPPPPPQPPSSGARRWRRRQSCLSRRDGAHRAAHAPAAGAAAARQNGSRGPLPSISPTSFAGSSLALIMWSGASRRRGYQHHPCGARSVLAHRRDRRPFRLHIRLESPD